MFDGNILARNIHLVRPNFNARDPPPEESELCNLSTSITIGNLEE
jgi:hypothetical protein